MKPRRICFVISEELKNLFKEETGMSTNAQKSNFTYKALWNYWVSLSHDRNVSYGIQIMKDFERNLS